MDFEFVKKGIADGSLTLVDVRSRDEHKEKRIPGAKNLPIAEIGEAAELSEADFKTKYGFDKLPKDAPIATHCTKGGRASKGAAAFIMAGYTNVKVYPGFNDWVANDGTVLNG